MSPTFNKLFGNKDKPNATTSSPFSNLPGFAQTAIQDSLKTAQGFTPEMFQTAPITGQQQQAADYFASPVQPITSEQFQSGISTYSNPFENEVLKNLIADLNTQASGGFRDIASMASDVGGYGSNRRGLLEAELQKNLLKTVGDVSATSRASNFENAASRTLADIGNVRDLTQQNMQSLFDVGSGFQAQNTQNKNAPVALNSYLSSLALGVPTASGGLAQDTGLLGHPSVVAFMQGLGSSAGKVSDSRMKENIVYDGQEKGFNMYKFNYKGHPGRYRGVMAQEVMEKRPDAVTSINGILRVFYDKLGLKMEEVSV